MNISKQKPCVDGLEASNLSFSQDKAASNIHSFIHRLAYGCDFIAHQSSKIPTVTDLQSFYELRDDDFDGLVHI